MSKKTRAKPSPGLTWPPLVHAYLTCQGVRQVAVVPDSGHSQLIRLCEADREIRVVRLTTEE